MRRLATILAVAGLLIFAPLASIGKNTSVTVLDDVTVSTAGGAVSVTVVNTNASSAYLVYSTADEAATASLVVTVYAISDGSGSDVLICTGSTVTTETTNTILVGSLATAAGSIGVVCDFPVSRLIKFIFTVSGGSASFDISAVAELLAHGAP